MNWLKSNSLKHQYKIFYKIFSLLSFLLFFVAFCDSLALAKANVPEKLIYALPRLRLAYDHHGLITANSGKVHGHLEYESAALIDYNHDPLVIIDGATENEIGALVKNKTDGKYLFSLGLYNFLEIGIDIPFTFYQSGEQKAYTFAAVPNLKAVGLGDWGFFAKAQILEQEKHFFDVSVNLHTIIPFGTAFLFLGEESYVFTPEIASSANMNGFKLALNLGFSTRGNDLALYQLKLSEQWLYRFGLGYDWYQDGKGSPFELDAEVFGNISASHPFNKTNEQPLEADIAFKYWLSNELQFLIGGGLGIVSGYGSPDYRIFGGFRWIHRNEDPDNDGVKGKDDLCSLEPEDIDQFKDEDGCPDPDNDRDGILDIDDKCPNEAENKNGIEDEDGCPEKDSDKDGILDPKDQCPNDPETMNDYQDTDGCPDQKVEGPKAILTSNKIEILEPVFFEHDSDIIYNQSYPLLDQIVVILNQHHEIALLEIQGHTDSSGDASYNLDLSQRRAKSVVNYLVASGINESRLKATGFGEANPIDNNDTNEGKAKNRRVEFHILQKSEQ